MDTSGNRTRADLIETAKDAQQKKMWLRAAYLWRECFDNGVVSAAVRQAFCFLAFNHYGACCEAVIAGIKGGADREKLLVYFERATLRMSQAGQFVQAYRYWKQLLDDETHGETVQRHFLTFSSAIANLTPETEAIARRVLERPVDADSFRAALRIIWSKYGHSRDLLDACTRAMAVSDEFREALKKDELVLLSLSGREDAVASRLAASADLLDSIAELAPAAHVAKTLARDEPQSLRIGEYAEHYRALAKNTEQLWSSLSNPSLRIAVVGNSPAGIGSNKGLEIDAHDIVVRFNKFSTAENYAADYGTKTSLLVRLGNDSISEQQAPQSIPVVLSGIRTAELWRNWPFSLQLADAGYNISYFPDLDIAGLIDRLEARPSAGILFLHCLNQLRGGLANVDCYGFSFTDQLKRGSTSHYFNKERPTFRHNWRAERAYLAELKPEIFDRNGQQRPKARIVGDHSDYHVGCEAVIDYITSVVSEKYDIVDDEDYDVLFINGEGSMHHRSRAYDNKIAAARDAMERQKKFHLINTVWQENGDADADVLRAAESIIVRETLSKRSLLKETGIASRVIPDFSYFTEIDEKAGYDDLNGAVAITDFYSSEFSNFVRLTGGVLAANNRYVDMKATSWSSLVRTLRTSRMLITGRHHAVYAACRARIPFVAVTGNTHKIEGIVASSKIKIPICKHPREITRAIRWANNNNNAYGDLFDWLDEQQGWAV